MNSRKLEDSKSTVGSNSNLKEITKPHLMEFKDDLKIEEKYRRHWRR